MRIACVQKDVRLGAIDENVASLKAQLRQLAGEGVDLVVFPEAALTGYCVECHADAVAIALEIDSPPIATIVDLVNELGIMTIFGFAAREGERVTNVAMLLESGVPPRVYRKTHLPILGLDNFVTPGDELPVFETRHGRIGILICYDVRLPEPARVLALRGADVLVLPTNWPRGAEISADVVAVARAAENQMYVATCNRVGEENGFSFFGRSKIIAPNGRILQAAEGDETVLRADLDLSLSRQKRVVTAPGRHEVEVFGSRRPKLYGPLVELDTSLPEPGESSQTS
jgi:predicted amidohydrolase